MMPLFPTGGCIITNPFISHDSAFGRPLQAIDRGEAGLKSLCSMEFALVAFARILSRFYTTWKPWATGLLKDATVTTTETWQLSLLP